MEKPIAEPCHENIECPLGTAVDIIGLPAAVAGNGRDGADDARTLCGKYISERRQVGSGSWSTVRQVDYTYYDSASYGNTGDLKFALGVVSESIDDDSKAQYRRSNVTMRDALRAELANRGEL